MSSCFNGDGHARQLGWIVATLAMLASGLAHAQTPDSSEPFTSGAAGRTTLGSTPLRIWHRTEGFGQEASETAFGGRAAIDLAGAVGFMDGQFRISNESRFGTNIGGGVRWYADDFLTGAPRILGVSGWYDGQETFLDNYFNQAGVSFESLGEFIDLRMNANIPFEDQKSGDMSFLTGGLNFAGNTLSQATLVPTDVSLRVIDFEAAARVLDLNAWVYGGGYQMDGNGISETGSKGGVRGYLTNDLAVDVGVTDDEVFGTNTVFQIIWTPGRTGAGPTSWIHTLADRMREPVYRNTYIATDQVQTEGSIALSDAAGQALNIVHVDSTAAANGDGTFERPFNNLADVTANTQQGDIILAHHDSVFANQSVTLKDEQRFLGEGDRNADGMREQQLITTAQLGTIAIPATSSMADTGAVPLIQNLAGSAIILAGGTNQVSDFTEIEVSNFRITGGTNAITSPGGVGDVNINRLDIASTTGDAIQLSALTETLANSTRVRFTPTIDDVNFDLIGGDDIRLDSGTQASPTTPVETIVISDVTSEGGNGVGVNLLNSRRTTTISNYMWDGNATGDGAIRVEAAGTQAAITLNGTSSISEGQTSAPDTTGYAINLVNSAGAMTVTGTTITDTGGDSIIADGGTMNLNFTGRINKGPGGVATASIVSVLNGHDGNMTFTELIANAGVINATTGDGLQFNNADGVYTFNDRVILTGTSSAINVQGASSGAITIADGEFTNTTGDTITFNGGTAGLDFTGRISQTANDASILSVSGGHVTGALIFNELTAGTGVINATMGDGLQFNNADGTYTFNDGVTLNGGDAGIDVVGGSSGTIALTDADNVITNPTGDALVIQNSSAIFTYEGAITTNNTSGRPVLISGNTGGSITIQSTVTSTDDGMLVENNTGGAVLFSDQVTLTTALNDGVTIQTNSGGSVQFNNLDVTTTAGDAFVGLNGTGTSTITVLAGAGNTFTTTTGTGLSLNNVIVGGGGITVGTLNKTGAGSAIVLEDVTGGLVRVNGGTVTGTTVAAVSITNAENVSLNSMSITAAGGDGVDFIHDTGASRLSLNNTTISGTAGEGISINVTGAATVANITVDQATVNSGAEQGILLVADGGAKTVNLLVEDSTFTNSSATNQTALFQAADSTILNATVLNNDFINGDASATARPFEMATTNAGATINLNLDQSNLADTAGNNDYFLTEAVGSTFTIEDVADVETRNTGDFTFTPNKPAFSNNPGPITTPENPD